MYTRLLIPAMIVGTVALSACDRTERNVNLPPKLEKLPAQAERQIERAGAVLDDATVTAKVKTALIAEPGLKGLSINVDTSANTVTLNGTVGSDDLRRQAERVARGIEGVKDVKNNLAVKPAS